MEKGREDKFWEFKAQTAKFIDTEVNPCILLCWQPFLIILAENFDNFCERF